MTNSELIELLQKLPSDLPVRVVVERAYNDFGEPPLIVAAKATEEAVLLQGTL